MMIDRGLLRGLCLIGIALGFGLQSLRYPIGDIARAGPGMFPLVVSSALLLVGAATAVRSLFEARVPLVFNLRNVGLILGSLVGFALVSEYVDMAVGIVVLVFGASLASPPVSVVRNVQIAAVLIGIAYLFQRLFGLALNLF